MFVGNTRRVLPNFPLFGIRGKKSEPNFKFHLQSSVLWMWRIFCNMNRRERYDVHDFIWKNENGDSGKLCEKRFCG